MKLQCWRKIGEHKYLRKNGKKSPEIVYVQDKTPYHNYTALGKSTKESSAIRKIRKYMKEHDKC